jgi:type II secretory pathway pseudopilin PulG
MKFKIIKAAMFGLDARIKKLCHTGLDPVSHPLNNKHAAMFGLDARIALAIFGALSVISGAALYSAIQNAQATAVLADIKELGKAWEQYYLDTGEYLPQPTSYTVAAHAKYHRNMTELVSSTKSGWQGPYINYTVGAYDYYSLYPKFNNGQIMFVLAPDSSWGESSSWTDTPCDETSNCFIWITVYNLPYSSTKAIDLMVDGSNSPDTGDIRTNSVSVTLKYAPAPLTY